MILPIGKTDMNTQRIHLSKLAIAPENARFGTEPDVSDLLVSIPAVGDLVDPLHVYQDGDKWLVWDGGRRLAALLVLDNKGKKSKLPDVLKSGVPCLISDKAEAAVHSLTTFTRAGLHPAQEFARYLALDADGKDVAAIAAACGATARRVSQLLRLRTVAPEILAEFSAGKIGLDVVEAFSVSPDHDRQRSVYEGMSPDCTAYNVKSAFRQGAVDPSDRWAKFVGREAYAEAGGTFLNDLFAREGEETWADRALVQQLAQAKVATMLKKFEDEGWKEAWFIQAGDQNYGHPWYDFRSKWNRAEKPAGGKWSKEAMAASAVLIVQDHKGDLDVLRGMTRKPSPAAAAKAASPATLEPELYGYGHEGHNIMTYAATRATRVGLVRRPHVAYDALLTHLAWMTFGNGSTVQQTSAINLVSDNRWGQAPPVDVDGDDEIHDQEKAWRERLDSSDQLTFCDQVAALDPDEKAQLLAVCVAAQVDAREDKYDQRKPHRWAHLGWMAKRAGVDMAAAKALDLEFYRKRASKPALMAAEKALNPGGKFTPSNQGWPNVPKDQLAHFVARRAEETGWLPKLLATFMDVGDAASRKAAKGEARAKAVAELAANITAAEAPQEGEGGNEADDLSEAVLALATGRSRPIADQDEADQD